MFGTVAADSRKSNAATSAVMVSSNITSTNATTTLQNWAVPGYLFQSVIGYVPFNFKGSQTVAPDYAFFNSTPGQYSQTNPSVTDKNILLLPIGAKICGIYLTNNGVEITAGTNPYIIYIAAIDINSPATNPQILLRAPIEDINTFGGIGKGINENPFDINLPITGAAYTSVVSENALLTASYGLGFQMSFMGDFGLLTGELGVIVSYILPGPGFGTTTPITI
jgi:hypothetical protein